MWLDKGEKELGITGIQGTSLRALAWGPTGEPLLGDSELKTSAEP